MSFNPGVELVLEAFEQYWRETPNIKRITLRVIPDESTRLAALKGGEIDIAYSVWAELAEELQRTGRSGSSPSSAAWDRAWRIRLWPDRRLSVHRAL